MHGGGGHGGASRTADGDDPIQLAVGVKLTDDGFQPAHHVAGSLAAHIAAYNLFIVRAGHLGLGEINAGGI